MKTLADKICQAADNKRFEPLTRMMTREAADKIRSAQRFVISEDIREAVHDLLIGRPSSLLEGSGFARPPFDRVWLEWETPNQPDPIADVRVRTKAIGAMVEVIPGSNGRAFSFWTAWSHDTMPDRAERIRKMARKLGAVVTDEEIASIESPGLGFSSMQIGIDLDHMESDPRHLNGWNISNPDHSPSELARLRDDRTNGVRYAIKNEKERQALIKLNSRVRWSFRDDPVQQTMLAAASSFGEEGMKAAIDDVRDETGPVLAALILMNARNCIDIKRVEPDPGLVKARLKSGNKPPPLSYSTVHIHLGQGDSRAAERYNASAAERRRHIVRGHFKVRASGVYWWRPFLRGSLNAGTVERAGYEVAL
jgi:hypothetical protein